VASRLPLLEVVDTSPATTIDPSHRWLTHRVANLVLFSVTFTELTFLVFQTETFTFVDWIYVTQNLVVLGLALTRRRPQVVDCSVACAGTVVVSFAYPYGQVALLGWHEGHELWPEAGLVLVTVAALLSFASLLSLGRSFGIRPAVRRLVTRGPYHFVRHPMYLSYFLADVGYNLQEWSIGTVLLVLIGWMSLIYRIHAEEHALSKDPEWTLYAANVPDRLLPGLW